MEDINLETERTEKVDVKPFKSFERKSELDDFLKIQEENLKTKLESEIKSKIEKEAKLTADYSFYHVDEEELSSVLSSLESLQATASLMSPR